MQSFDPAKYGPSVAKLLDNARLCELGPGRPNRNVREALSELSKFDVVSKPGELHDAEMAECCLSGLWLWHDFLHESHEISQDIHSKCGSYWHGIMHRREPDYSNSKYWYRQVGDHEIFPSLQEATAELAQSHALDGAASKFANKNDWDPYAFVDLCAAVARGNSDCEQFCREVARTEWQLLFDHCFELA